MPYCEPCQQYHTPSGLTEDGECPSCGVQLAETTEPEESSRAPWHFRLLILVLVVYLGYRAVQGIEWLLH